MKDNQHPMNVIEEQADDPTFYLEVKSTEEKYIRKELRKLHESVEAFFANDCQHPMDVIEKQAADPKIWFGVKSMHQKYHQQALRELHASVELFFENEGKKGKSTCGKCDGAILADTEDWDIPLCHECYEKRLAKNEVECGMFSLKEKTPPTNRPILLKIEQWPFYCVGVYVQYRTVNADDFLEEDFEESLLDYDEEKDIYFVEEGFYECRSSDGLNYQLDSEVIGWMTLGVSKLG